MPMHFEMWTLSWIWLVSTVSTEKDKESKTQIYVFPLKTECIILRVQPSFLLQTWFTNFSNVLVIFPTL